MLFLTEFLKSTNTSAEKQLVVKVSVVGANYQQPSTIPELVTCHLSVNQQQLEKKFKETLIKVLNLCYLGSCFMSSLFCSILFLLLMTFIPIWCVTLCVCEHMHSFVCLCVCLEYSWWYSKFYSWLCVQ